MKLQHELRVRGEEVGRVEREGREEVERVKEEMAERVRVRGEEVGRVEREGREKVERVREEMAERVEMMRREGEEEVRSVREEMGREVEVVRRKGEEALVRERREAEERERAHYQELKGAVERAESEEQKLEIVINIVDAILHIQFLSNYSLPFLRVSELSLINERLQQQLTESHLNSSQQSEEVHRLTHALTETQTRLRDVEREHREKVRVCVL